MITDFEISFLSFLLFVSLPLWLEVCPCVFCSFVFFPCLSLCFLFICSFFPCLNLHALCPLIIGKLSTILSLNFVNSKIIKAAKGRRFYPYLIQRNRSRTLCPCVRVWGFGGLGWGHGHEWWGQSKGQIGRWDWPVILANLGLKIFWVLID